MVLYNLRLSKKDKPFADMVKKNNITPRVTTISKNNIIKFVVLRFNKFIKYNLKNHPFKVKPYKNAYER